MPRIPLQSWQLVKAAKRVLTKSMAHTNGPRYGTHYPSNNFLRDEWTCLLMRNLAGSLKVFCLFQIKQIWSFACLADRRALLVESRYLESEELQVIPPIHTPAANCFSTAQSYRTLEIEMSWQVRVQMPGIAAKGYTRAAVSCTFSTAGFQNSRNEVLALLAEAFGNSSVWSQHVTNGIINVL